MVSMSDYFWGYDSDPNEDLVTSWIPGLNDETWLKVDCAINTDFDDSLANPDLSRRAKADILSNIVTAVVLDSALPQDPKEFQDRLINLAAQALMWAAAERELNA